MSLPTEYPNILHCLGGAFLVLQLLANLCYLLIFQVLMLDRFGVHLVLWDAMLQGSKSKLGQVVPMASLRVQTWWCRITPFMLQLTASQLQACSTLTQRLFGKSQSHNFLHVRDSYTSIHLLYGGIHVLCGVVSKYFLFMWDGLKSIHVLYGRGRKSIHIYVEWSQGISRLFDIVSKVFKFYMGVVSNMFMF